MVIKPGEVRVVSVSFMPKQGGPYGAILQLTFHDHKRKADFVVERELTGWAERPSGSQGQYSDKPAPNAGSLPINHLSQPSPPNPRLITPEITSLVSQDNLKPLTLDEDPHECGTVSHEDGLDFVAEGTGSAANHSFPPISHTISIENTSSLSSLSVKSMKLEPSPSPWCEWSGDCMQFLMFLLTAFLLLCLERQ